jgi:hypothetical protein
MKAKNKIRKESRENKINSGKKIKKQIKEFFRPTIGKIALPVIVILLFLGLLALTYNLSITTGKFTCEIFERSFDYQDAVRNNNIILANDLKNQIGLLQTNITNYAEKNKLALGTVIYSNRYIGQIDALYPVPCTVSPKNMFCAYYTDDETYKCIKKAILAQTTNQDSITNDLLPPYWAVSVPLLLLNYAIFFIIFYLASSVVVFIYRKIKKNGK